MSRSNFNRSERMLPHSYNYLLFGLYLEILPKIRKTIEESVDFQTVTG